MAWRCTGKTNKELIQNLVNSQIIRLENHPERIAKAMESVDRAHYVRNASTAYEDSPQAIGHGATISAPHMHAYAIDHLMPFLRSGARVLDVGSGSGYLCAVLHHLVSESPGGKVVGIDHISELVDLSIVNLGKDAVSREALARGEIEMVVGDGRLGYPADGPFDAIHVGAAAPTIPKALVEQLAQPGRMFIPVGTDAQHIVQVDKDAQGNVTETRIMSVQYVPLTDKEKQIPW